jgi:GT2 family glycosyltransferase
MISIIVTSYTVDRLVEITGLLDSLANLDPVDYELIYVTEGDERLNEIVKDLVVARSLVGKVIHNSGRKGLSEARNLGIEAAAGDILAFVDDDVVVDAGWGSSIMNAFESLYNIVAATGPSYPIWASKDVNVLPAELDWLLGCTRWFNRSEPTLVPNAWGMNMCFRKSSLVEVGGFKPGNGLRDGRVRGGVGEDVELSVRIRNRAGGNIFYLPQMKVYSIIKSRNLTGRYVIERSLRVGYDRRFVERESKAQGDTGSYEESRILYRLLKEALNPIGAGRTQDPLGSILRLKVTTLAIAGLGLGYLLGPA